MTPGMYASRYLPPQSPNGTDESNCGEDYPWDLTGTQAPAISDMWHSVKIYVGRNSFVNGDAQSDGVQKVWLDGELVFHKTDWIYDWTGEHLCGALILLLSCGSSKLDATHLHCCVVSCEAVQSCVHA